MAEQEISKCSHQDTWHRVGQFPVTLPDKILVVTTLFCRKCGHSRINVQEIEIKKMTGPQQPNIIIPKMQVGPRRN